MKAIKVILGTIVFTLILGIPPIALGNQLNEGDSLQYATQHPNDTYVMAKQYQQYAKQYQSDLNIMAKQYHSNRRVMALTRSITGEFGAACFTALHDYYGRHHDFSHLLILRNSPLMAWGDGLHLMDAALIGNIIHVKAGATLDLVHEIRHAIHQQRMGAEFYAVYAEAHSLPDTAGYFFEQQALQAKRGFRMNYGPVCENPTTQ